VIITFQRWKDLQNRFFRSTEELEESDRRDNMKEFERIRKITSYTRVFEEMEKVSNIFIENMRRGF